LEGVTKAQLTLMSCPCHRLGAIPLWLLLLRAQVPQFLQQDTLTQVLMTLRSSSSVVCGERVGLRGYRCVSARAGDGYV
jgi:hypothetical protein